MKTAGLHRLRELLDPWGEFTRLERMANGLMAGARPNDVYPPVNLWTSEEETIVTAELPGIEKEALDISLDEQQLTISARRSAEELPEGASYARQERRQGEFVRGVRLPYPVEADQVSASYSEGVLEIRLPRAEADKPRRIQVTTG